MTSITFAKCTVFLGDREDRKDVLRRDEPPSSSPLHHMEASSGLPSLLLRHLLIKFNFQSLFQLPLTPPGSQSVPRSRTAIMFPSSLDCFVVPL